MMRDISTPRLPDHDMASGLMPLRPSFDAKLEARVGACLRLYNSGDISGAATGLRPDKLTEPYESSE